MNNKADYKSLYSQRLDCKSSRTERKALPDIDALKKLLSDKGQDEKEDEA